MKFPWATRPSSIAALTWAAVFGLRAMPIATFRPLTDAVCLLLAVGLGLFLGGFFLGRNLPFISIKRKRMLQLTQSEKSKLTTFVLIFACIGALGALMRVYDFLFLRGLDYSAGLGAARLENMRLVEEAGAGTNYLVRLEQLASC